MKKLKKIYVEITSVCNLNCPFCSPPDRTAHFMSEDDFISILDKIEGRSNVLYLHVMGEPLLHPLVCRFITLGAQKGFKVFVTTNGTMLPKREAELLECSALSRFNISLQSLEQFAEENRIPLMHEILTTAEKLVERNPKLLINLRLWTSDVKPFTSQMCAALEERYKLAFGDIMRRMEESSGIFLASGIAVHRAETFDWPDTLIGAETARSVHAADTACTSVQDRTCEAGAFCMALRDQAAVLCDGTVVPCCLDRGAHIALGNILSDCSWNDIMQSPRARRLYDGFSRREAAEKLCRTCTFRRRFGR